MAIDFPTSPAVGQRYAYAGINYIFTSQGIWSVTSLGGAAVSTSKISVQTFTASGMYTPTPGTQFVMVECIGGGASGGAALSGASDNYQGGGGGSGGYSRSYLTAAQIGTSQLVTVGAGGALTSGNGNSGGATSFGGLCVANGGSGGLIGSSGSNPYGGAGAAPGTGDIAVAGTIGGFGIYNNIGTAPYCLPGLGGVGPFGGGTGPSIAASAPAATGYGTGGSGGSAYATGATRNGGAGAAGICIVTEYNIANAGPQGPVGPQGGTTGVAPPQGRLTLQSNTPVMTTTQASKAIVYYSQYVGDKVPIYDGSVFTMTTFTELSCATTDTTKNPSAIGVNKVNDWFVWNDAGTMRLCHGPDWTNDTTRSAGTGIIRQNGIWMNATAITNGPGILRGTYVGTTRSSTSGLMDWKYGGLASTGGPSFFGVWNAYNRVNVASMVADADSGATFSSTSFVALPAGMRHTFVCGLAEDAFEFSYNVYAVGVGGFAAIGIGYDVTNTFSGNSVWVPSGVSIGGWVGSYSTPALGCHFACSVVVSNAGGMCSVYGTVGYPSQLQSGFFFRGKM